MNSKARSMKFAWDKFGGSAECQSDARPAASPEPLPPYLSAAFRTKVEAVRKAHAALLRQQEMRAKLGK